MLGGYELAISRPARNQVAKGKVLGPQRAITQAIPPGGNSSYNIYYNKHTGQQGGQKKNGGNSSETVDGQPAGTVKAPCRCDPDRDSGLTKGSQNPNSYFCVFFAKGSCPNGSDCRWIHRIPDPVHDRDLGSNAGIDIFGRERHATTRQDMAGTGAILTNNTTLYVGNVNTGDFRTPSTLPEVIVRKHFQVFGTIDGIKILKTKGVAFVTFVDRMNAEFAREAMMNQSLDHNEILNIRWATEDPNQKAVEKRAKKVAEARAKLSAAAKLKRQAEEKLVKEKRKSLGAELAKNSDLISSTSSIFPMMATGASTATAEIAQQAALASMLMELARSRAALAESAAIQNSSSGTRATKTVTPTSTTTQIEAKSAGLSETTSTRRIELTAAEEVTPYTSTAPATRSTQEIIEAWSTKGTAKMAARMRAELESKHGRKEKTKLKKAKASLLAKAKAEEEAAKATSVTAIAADLDPIPSPPVDKSSNDPVKIEFLSAREKHRIKYAKFASAAARYNTMMEMKAEQDDQKEEEYAYQAAMEEFANREWTGTETAPVLYQGLDGLYYHDHGTYGYNYDTQQYDMYRYQLTMMEGSSWEEAAKAEERCSEATGGELMQTPPFAPTLSEPAPDGPSTSTASSIISPAALRALSASSVQRSASTSLTKPVSGIPNALSALASYESDSDLDMDLQDD